MYRRFDYRMRTIGHEIGLVLRALIYAGLFLAAAALLATFAAEMLYLH
jgi:hypothetical protein